MADPTNDLLISQTLIQDFKGLAQELNMSWSRLITVVLQDFIHRYHARDKLTIRINNAYSETSEQENQILQQMQSSHRKIVEGEW